ncbi:MAG: response regulator [Candidatus Bathyarchaeia archaeon]
MSKLDVQPAEILLVDDDWRDVRRTMDTLKNSKIANNLNVIGNGVDAISYLKCEGKYSQSPRPDLILLDLNLPKKDGREVLMEIKEDSKLQNIPVAILTTSQTEREVLRSNKLQANCYISKPVDLKQFNKVVESIESIWFSLVKLPPMS